MWSNGIMPENAIRGSCPRFACRCCHTKYGYPHQKWCEIYLLTQPVCSDCIYFNEKCGVCRHPAKKSRERSVGKLKKINVRFEPDNTLDTIDIVIRAKEHDAQVDEIIKGLTSSETAKITALDSDNCQTVIEATDIVFISAEGKNVNIVTGNGNFRAKQSLQNIEKLLGKDFLRVSRFEIVNLKKVKKYDFTLVGTLRVEFYNGMETWASRRYIPLIKERISRKEGYMC